MGDGVFELDSAVNKLVDFKVVGLPSASVHRFFSGYQDDVKEIKKVVDEIRKFINTGMIGTVTTQKLVDELNKIVPPKYNMVVVQIVTALSSQKYDIIDADAKALILEVLDGTELRANRYVR